MKYMYSRITKTRPVNLSVFSIQGLLLLLFPLLQAVHGQRLKQSCWELEPFSCDSPRVTEGHDIDIDIALLQQWEETCLELIVSIFPDDSVTWVIDSHLPYLNSIAADDPFCPLIKQAYPQCFFCFAARDWKLRWQCQDDARVTVCGNQPTVDEVLEDKNNGFTSRQDIDATCQLLEESYQHVWVRDFNFAMPTTMELCQRQTLVKHLCPGYCNGTCFDEWDHPPLCDNDSDNDDVEEGEDNILWGNSTSNNNTDNNSSSITNSSTAAVAFLPRTKSLDEFELFEICKEINWRVFYELDIGLVLNTSNHLDYLRVIQADDPFCPLARQAYQHCFWCSDERCFGTHWPTSCEAPSTATSTSTSTSTSFTNATNNSNTTTATSEEIDEQYVCKELTYAFDNVAFDDELTISAHAFLIPDNIPFCDQARQVYHKCFWCASNYMDEVPGSFCLVDFQCNSTVELPPDFVSTTLTALGFTIADLYLRPDQTIPCDEIHAHWQANWSEPFSLQACFEDIFLGRLCPAEFCAVAAAHEIDKNTYLGASTTIEKRSLIWVSRVSAIMSFFGGMYIIIDAMRDASARGLVYHQLLIGMAVFDVITAFAWVFATAPIDTSQAWWVEGAMGTQATCKAQSFFIQLGFGSIFYNVSLSLYYVLVIAYDWREFQLKAVRLYMQGIPIVLSIALAGGVVAKYHWFEYACHIFPPPEGDLWVSMIFVILPIGLSIISITVSMFMVYCKVRERAHASSKWSFGIGRADRIQQAVFWQALFYMLAFYVTWPILFAVYLASVDTNGPLALTITVAFVAPLQGFNNFLVYIRPKFIRREPRPARRSLSAQGGNKSSTLRFQSSLLYMLRFLPGASSRNVALSLESPPSSKFIAAIDCLDPSAALALEYSDDGVEANEGGASNIKDLKPVPETEEEALYQDPSGRRASGRSACSSRSALRTSILHFTGLDAEELDLNSDDDDNDNGDIKATTMHEKMKDKKSTQYSSDNDNNYCVETPESNDAAVPTAPGDGVQDVTSLQHLLATRNIKSRQT